MQGGKAMAANMRNRRSVIPWRAGGWGFAALILLLPLVAMLFTNEVNWTVSDFLFAGLMIGVTGLILELTVRSSRNPAYRGGVAFAVAASFLIVWANGAVGMVGDEDNPFNLNFFGVILVALVGAIVARFRPSGMTAATILAALAQVVIGVVGLSIDIRGGVLSAGFSGLWLLSAALFWKAARDLEAGAPTD
jgi:hypothetical protein